jgi:hypothetical protein
MPTVNTFASGDSIRFTGTFAISGTNTDPSVVTFRTKNPNGVVGKLYTYLTDDELVRSATGIYYIDLALSLVGEHHYRFQSTGVIAPGVSEGRIRIERSNVLQ